MSKLVSEVSLELGDAFDLIDKIKSLLDDAGADQKFLVVVETQRGEQIIGLELRSDKLSDGSLAYDIILKVQ